MSNTAPHTNRPQSPEDLRYQHQLDPITIMVKPDYDENPALAKWWGQTLASAMEVPGLTTQGSSIVRPRTPEEIQNILKREQDTYDRGHELYATYLETGEIPDYTYQWSDYLHYENLEKPEPDTDPTQE